MTTLIIIFIKSTNGLRVRKYNIEIVEIVKKVFDVEFFSLQSKKT